MFDANFHDNFRFRRDQFEKDMADIDSKFKEDHAEFKAEMQATKQRQLKRMRMLAIAGGVATLATFVVVVAAVVAIAKA